MSEHETDRPVRLTVAHGRAIQEILSQAEVPIHLWAEGGFEALKDLTQQLRNLTPAGAPGKPNSTKPD